MPSKLSEADKFELQQYITRCYGSLTAFTILFKNKDAQFRTSAAESPNGTVIRHQKPEIRNLSTLRRFSSVKKVAGSHDNGGNATATRFLCTNSNTDCQI